MIKVSIGPRDFLAGQDAALAVRFTNAGPGSCTDIVFKLELPPQFLLLRGRERIEIGELAEGMAETENLIVRPRTSGNFAVRSSNFSYRNYFGKSVREPGFSAELSVRAPIPGEADRPRFSVEHLASELTEGEYGIVPIRIRNTTDAPVHGLVLTATTTAAPHLQIDRPRIWLSQLSPGQAADINFSMFSDVSGDVPVHMEIAYTNQFGRTYTQNDRFRLSISTRKTYATRAAADAVKQDTILYLAASPKDMPALRSDKEMREIWEKLQRGRYCDRFRFEPRAAALREDISQALIDCSPYIVHFSGHGEPDGSVYVEDTYGHSTPVAAKGLAALFSRHTATVKCVIVNACHTLKLAEALSEHVDHVIAVPAKILDTTAIIFAVGFYQGLAAGMKVPDAFEEGRALFSTVPMDESRYKEPVLLTKTQKF
jgi:hypothetical protein